MMKVFSLLSVVAVAAAAPEFVKSEDGFSSWMAHYSQTFAAEEMQSRFEIWQSNYAVVELHNKQASAGMHTFFLGMNQFAAMTNEEFRGQMNGYRYSNATALKATRVFNASSVPAAPASVDWRTHSPLLVSPIKDQGQCGSCWAFSAVEAMEAVAAMKLNTKVTPGSPQQLVDCVKNGKDNCNRGGEMHDGYIEVMKEGGLDTERSYPYTARSNGVCRFKPNDVIAGTTNFTGYTKIPVDESALEKAVATVPTVSIAIDASSNAFQLYDRGVYNHPSCKNKNAELDHGVAIVGYGALNGDKYWLVRNSWGKSWGMQGYILMSKDKNNQCGVATDATYPHY